MLKFWFNLIERAFKIFCNHENRSIVVVVPEEICCAEDGKKLPIEMEVKPILWYLV